MTSPMYHYPIVFKCPECTLEHDTLDQLEKHIWNRHLGTFPFLCAICGYPNLNEKALTLHFQQDHPRKQVEFKRSLIKESQLRFLISQSISVPVEDSNEILYEDHAEQGDMESMQQPMEFKHEEEQYHMASISSEHHLGISRNEGNENLDGGSHWDEHPPDLKRQIDEEEIVYLDEMESMSEDVNRQHSHDDVQEGVEVISEVEEEMEMNESANMDEILEESVIEEENYEGDSHQQQMYLYNGELFEEGGEELDEDEDDLQRYIDQQGSFSDNIYLPKSEALSDFQMKLMKNRHMDMIVRKVAGDQMDMRKKMRTESHCDICGKYLKYPSRIEAHRRMHAQEKVFECHICEKTFTQRSSLNVHMRKHTGEKPYHCSWECGKTFISSSAQKMHEKSHSGERKFNCKICGQLFSKRSHVIRHHKSRHTEINDGEMEDDDDEEIAVETKAAVNDVIESVRYDKRAKLAIRQHEKELRKREMRITS